MKQVLVNKTDVMADHHMEHKGKSLQFKNLERKHDTHNINRSFSFEKNPEIVIL